MSRSRGAGEIALLAGSVVCLVAAVVVAVRMPSVSEDVDGFVRGINVAIWLGIAGVTGLVAAAVRRQKRRIMARFAGLESLRPSTLPEAGGRRGQATLLAVRDTGGSVNDNPSVVLSVRVVPADESEPFEADFGDLVPRIAVPRPGDTCPVTYVSGPPRRVARTGPFVTAQLSARSMSAAEVVQALGTLDELRRSGALTENEFAVQKARLLAG